jgi:hypothetical protein
MFVRDIEFQLSTVPLLSILDAGLEADWSEGLSSGGDIPDPKTARMVTVRDDSGPQDLVQERRRQGINCWAAPGEVERFARACMRIFRVHRGGGIHLDQFSGPFEVSDETPYVVDGVELAHFYFTCRASVKGTQPV